MAKSLGKILVIVFFSLFQSVGAQVLDTLDENVLQIFKDKRTDVDRFDYFFNTLNRYNENSAYDWLDEVNIYLNSAEKSGDSLAISNYKLMQSQIYFDLGDYDKSVAIANDLYAVKDIFDLKTKRILLDLIDDNYAQLKLYGKQVEIRQEKRDLGLTENITFYDIYSNLGLHRKAMEDYIMDMKKTIDNSDLYGLAEYNNNVGRYLLLDKSSSVSLSNFKKAKGYIDVYLNDVTQVKSEKELQKAKLLKGIIEGNIGKSYLQLKQFEEALPYLENSIELIKENYVGQYSEDVIENSLALADCHLQLENFNKAKDILNDDLNPKKSEHIVKKNRLLAAYYDRIEDYKNANFYLKKNVRIADSINSNDTSLKKQQLSTVAKYEIENSKRMIDAQKLEMERARSEMQQKDEQINLVFISLIFTLLGFAGLVYAYLKSIKNQRLIAEQNHIIENSLVEKDSLLKEIHHRVKNNLQMVSSLLSLQTKNTRSKAAIEALEEGKSRVKAMALIHQKLYQNDDLSVIEMQGYIESLVNSVQSVFKKGGHNINITIDAEGVELDIDRAIPFGLILNELVSNTFKYAFPEGDENGKIYIHLRKNGDQGFFEYTDNGVGLSEDSEERANSSMGVRLMKRLVNQLQSTLNIDKTTDGVRFWFNFK
ncbi:histidine kinase dimerization/phosphoacceptor domain -containing protein [uncultured Eudoraea sp.]|uniref:sensor histidine kinase n=1 Tax=uncultured Eudoraea sp. TaxID=1035614 RepID=UPI002630BB58|nr:histidine kinase dimerization/phosphoacceptor domain -containing protein [uncultured Eudoraea sp.]